MVRSLSSIHSSLKVWLRSPVPKESCVGSHVMCVQVGTLRQDEVAFNAVAQAEKAMKKQFTRKYIQIKLMMNSLVHLIDWKLTK